MSTVAEKLTLAAQYHQAGALPQAEQICLEVLEEAPGHADALHRLGILAFQRGDFSAAVTHIGSALKAKPGDPNYYSNLALAYQSLNQWEQAAACLAESIRIQPDFIAAHFNLGNVL